MKKEMISIALASSLALTACSTSTSSERTPDLTMTPAHATLSAAETQTLDVEFTNIKDYWRKRMPGISAVKFALLRANDTELCGIGNEAVTLKATNPDDIEYCFQSNTVILSAAGIFLLTAVAHKEQIPVASVTGIAIAHEVGHAVEEQEGAIPGTTHQQRQISEQTADCYAGRALETVQPAAISSAAKFYGLLNFYRIPIMELPTSVQTHS